MNALWLRGDLFTVRGGNIQWVPQSELPDDMPAVAPVDPTREAVCICDDRVHYWIPWEPLDDGGGVWVTSRQMPENLFNFWRDIVEPFNTDERKS